MIHNDTQAFILIAYTIFLYSDCEFTREFVRTTLKLAEVHPLCMHGYICLIQVRYNTQPTLRSAANGDFCSHFAKTLYSSTRKRGFGRYDMWPLQLL